MSSSDMRLPPRSSRPARRALALVVTLGLGLGLVNTSARARASDDALPCTLASGPARPSRVLLIGDSNFHGALGHRLTLGLAARGYDVVLRGKASSGLACPEYFDWFREAKRLIAASDPDLIVVMLGANDVQRITWPRLSRRVRFKDIEGWTVAYEARVRTFMQMLADDGREVVYLSPTNRGWEKARVAVERVRVVQQRVAEEIPRVHWVDMFPLSSDEHGNWLRFGEDEHGERIWYRQPDRIHLTKPGGELIGARLLRTLAGLGV